MDTGRELRGGQRQVLLLLEGLRAAGEDCLLLADPGSPLFQNARAARLPVYPASLLALRQHSKVSDIVHAHDARSHTLAALGARAPFVVSRRVAFPVKRSLLSQWKYRQALRFLAVSQFVGAELERGGIPKSKIDIVYDGVQRDFPPASWNPGNPAVALASFDPLKGRDLVTEAARLAGCPVIYSNDLPKDLIHASMFLYMTRAEGFGSAAVLAMGMGIPVIASNVGGLPEALGHGEAGILVANNPNDIAAAIRRIREDFTLGQTLIERGKKQMAESFTAQRMVEGTLASYRRALAV